jgi:two-component flavin-dependent monooxygenase
MTTDVRVSDGTTGTVLGAAFARTAAAEHADRSDTDRALAPEVAEAITAAGFVRHLVPAQWGGTQGGFGELTRAITVLGNGCTSAAWLASLLAYSARFGAYLPEPGQADLWDCGPDALIAAAIVPSGHATGTADGWRITGQWAYTSGVHLADWVLVCVRPDGDPKADPLFAAVPRSGVTVLPTWFTLGMRATASDTVILDDVLVPTHRVFRRSTLLAGQSVHKGRTYEIPFRAVSGLTFAAPLLGAATGALTDYLAVQAGKQPAVPPDAARASGEIDAAALLIQRAADLADQGEITDRDIARGLRDAALAASFLVGAVDRLVALAGTTGQSQGRPLQRFWRDLHTATSHVALRFDTASAAYAAQLATDPR